MTVARAARGPLFNVLLVCSANICRSPGAAVVLIDRLGDAVAFVNVESAGLQVREPKPACGEMFSLLQPLVELRQPVTSHESTELIPARLGSADLVLTATRSQRSEVVLAAPAMRASIFTMNEAARLLAGTFIDVDASSASSSRNRLAMLVTRLNGRRGTNGVTEPSAPRRRFGRGAPLSHPDDIADCHVDPAVTHLDTAALVVAAMTIVGGSLRSVLTEPEQRR